LIIGFTCGAFDILHAGHISMLEECKSQCDKLIVGLQTDPTIDRPNIKNKPIQSVLERWIQLKAVSYIDEIYPYETEKDLENLLAVLPITKRFIGKDHVGESHTGGAICIAKNIEIVYNSRYHSWSSTELRKKLR
jgi:glycerol-3-phosphate cytidylyltransferase